MKSTVLKLVTACVGFVGLAGAATATANDHKFPDITGYEKPFVMYQKLPSASSGFVKMVGADGKRDDVDLSVERYTVGLMRERYDNKYAYIGIFGATGEGDDVSLTTGKKAKLSDQVGFVYGNGVHLSDFVDWSLYLEISSGKMSADSKSRNEVGVGLGTELNIGIGQYVDIGLLVHASVHYIGTGVGLKINF